MIFFLFFFFFFNDTATTEIYTLSLHDALPTSAWTCTTCGPSWPGWSTSPRRDRKSTRLNSSHSQISYAVFCLKKKKTRKDPDTLRKKWMKVRHMLGPLSSLHSGILAKAGGATEQSRFDLCIFFFNDPATTEIYSLSLHDALPI